MNCRIVTMIRSMTLDCVVVIPHVLWPEAYSTGVYIKNCLLYCAVKLKKSSYEILFGDKPSIKHIYPFRVKCYVHVPQEKHIATSKLSTRGINYYVVSYTESSKILQLYDPHKR
jgi:hypothetical protein